ERVARGRAVGPRGAPVDRLRPAPDDPELRVRELPVGDETVDFLVHVESLVPVVGPVMGDEPERLTRRPYVRTERMKDSWIGAVGHDDVRPAPFEPSARVIVAEPLGNEHGEIGRAVGLGEQAIDVVGALPRVALVDTVTAGDLRPPPRA